MDRVKVILFDAGNTLVHVNLSVISDLLRKNGIPVQGPDLAAAELRIRRALDQPEYFARSNDRSRWELYFGRLLDEVRAPRRLLDDLRVYHDRWNLWNTVPPEVPPLLLRLQQRYRLGVVSNSNGRLAELLSRLQLSPFFETVQDSDVEGIEKPDPRIFQIALDRLEARPEEAVHVGDLFHVDILGARAAGVAPILLDPSDLNQDRDCLRIRTLTDIEPLLKNT